VPQKKPQPKKRKRSRKSKDNLTFFVGTALGVLGLILGSIALIPIMRAKPTVSLEPPLDPGNVFSTPFEIRNSGEVSLHNIRAAVLMKGFRDAGNMTIDMGSSGWRILSTPDTLDPNDSVTVAPFDHTIRTVFPIVAGDYAVVLLYRPSFFPFTRMRGFRFTVVQQADGHSRLVPQPEADVVTEYEEARKAIHSN
jgi:hypothetical protein